MSYGPPSGPRDGRTRAYPVPGPPNTYDRQDRGGYGRRDQGGYGQRDQGGYRQPPPHDGGGVGLAEQPRAPRRRRRWGRIVLIVLLVLFLLVAAAFIYLETAINRVSALGDYPGRPAAGAGTNWLIVGSDSRAGLNVEDQERLSTGDAAGQRTDTMILLHIPDNSQKPTMVSLLRDSYVDIPGKGKNKLNAAYAFGGPKLLAQTVETATGLRLDHYIEIGFGGFANIVDAVGGVDVCLDKPMNDPLAGINLPAGCQTLDGANSLGYVRSRHTSAGSDLDRVVHQRQFVGALMKKATSFGTVINPFRLVPLIADIPDAITLDSGDHLWNLPALGSAMSGASSGSTITTTVPFSGNKSVPKIGSVILWNDTKAKTLFDALRTDGAVPDSVIVAPSGS
ncbi:LCP family protein [Actinocrispum wychmicini]|uniref:LytR family transcriptional attenuator n=1 Tax=Actinocrispum wychmicini TaxID=1213861 RepID=A0A4V2S5V2_9PSEU|nr:LCP family protein [Actinocrispum wychmicini]TCO53600.1 LytR family transcriptional attenuator [Actinocrispum wychmicini]